MSGRQDSLVGLMLTFPCFVIGCQRSAKFTCILHNCELICAHVPSRPVIASLSQATIRLPVLLFQSFVLVVMPRAPSRISVATPHGRQVCIGVVVFAYSLYPCLVLILTGNPSSARL